MALRMGKTEDGRHWVCIKDFMVGFLRVEEKDINAQIKHIPKPYIKVVEQKGEKLKFIDRMALGMIVSQFNNCYEAYKFAAARSIGKFDKYFIELFCESGNNIINKVNNIALYKRDYADANQVQQDILHTIENATNLTKQEKSEIYDDLRILRNKRRTLKNSYKLLEILKVFFDKHNIRSSDIQDLYNKINGLNNLSAKKIYNKRGYKAEHEKFINSSNKY